MRAASNRRRIWAVVAGLALAMSACARNAPQDYLQPEGPEARMLDQLWDPVFLVAALMFVLVEGLVVLVVLKFRARGDDDAPVQVHGNTKMEIGWTIIPALLMAFVGVGTLATIFKLSDDPEKGFLEVKVVGHQFWWEFEYPEGFRTANELHIPTGRDVLLTMTAAEYDLKGPDDKVPKGVIHSFWIPKLAGKQDVVPNRTAELLIRADRAGRYKGQCTEFCGASHANMRAVAVAHAPADYAAWVRGQMEDAQQPTSGVAAEGAEQFVSSGCIGCHTVRGFTDAQGSAVEGGRRGPDLTHLMSRRVFAGAMFELDEPHLRRWLRDPPGEKPMNEATGMPNLGLSEDDITELVAYLKTLE